MFHSYSIEISPVVLGLFRYNKRVRKLENIVLQQATGVPNPPTVSTDPLPLARELLPEVPRHGGQDHAYHLPPNKMGQATTYRRKQGQKSTFVPQLQPKATTEIPVQTSSASLTQHSPEPPSSTRQSSMLPHATDDTTTPETTTSLRVSRSTAYRMKRNMELGKQPVYKKRVAYNRCSKCGQPSIAETGHSKHKGYVFCPNIGELKHEWVAGIDLKLSSKSKKDS